MGLTQKKVQDTSFIFPRQAPLYLSYLSIFRVRNLILNFSKKFNLCNILAFCKVWSRFRIDFALQALQCSLILIILFITVVTNISIVLNIRNSEIKRRIVSFLLIKNLCIVDTVGAMLILPVPLAATFRGKDTKPQSS